MQNSALAKIFWKMAQLLELKQENPFKIRAYRNAAQNIESLSQNLADLYAQGGLKSLENIPGIGAHIAQKIEEALKTGKITAYQQLQKEFPRHFLDLAAVPGMGPKTALLLYKTLHIDSLDKLEKAARIGQLRKIPSLGAKKEANILRGIALKKAVHGRFLIDEATAQAELIIEELQKLKYVEKILPCGSLRRGQETIGDLDILVTSAEPQKVMTTFTKMSFVKDILAKGTTKASILLNNGMQADLRVVEAKSFGAAAHYFTGSKEHNIHIRQLAQKKGWKVSEYGVFKDEKYIGGQSEEQLFSLLDLQYIPPELREMRGEFEAAANSKIPKLIELEDIRGDLHMHTTASDGANHIEEMALAAKALGREYILITDHTQSTRVAGGLTEEQMRQHIKHIRAVNKNIQGIEVLAGAEVDILPDGRLDYPDDLLRECDIVLASIHSNFKMSKEKMTQRIIKAFENKYCRIFTHPTGRLIGEREAYALDMEQILLAANKYNVAMEINAHPRRLDLSDIYCKRAKELGVKIVISTDAHAIDQLELMSYGVITARRGWLEAKDVLNTLPIAKLRKVLYAA